MKAIVLLVIITVITLYSTTTVSAEINGFFWRRQNDQESIVENLLDEKVPRMMEKLMEEQGSSNEQENGINSMSMVPLTRDPLSRSRDQIFKISCERDTGRTLFQSDIALTERQVEEILMASESGDRKKRQVLKDDRYPQTTWQNGVFYMFNTSEPVVQAVFKMAVKVWSEATCIDFREDKNAKDKVVVVTEGGCWSNVGRQGGDQLLSLTWNATVGSAIHEIGHILGFFHTMSRYDRNTYIRLERRNIDPRELMQFTKMTRHYVDVYGLTYDYGSIMHYGELSYSSNRQPTMFARDPHYQKTMGSELISFSDIFTINEHYGCNIKCNKTTSAKCANEGYPHPRNCSICICPSGYGGVLCDRRPPGCGEDLVATNRKQNIAYSLGFGTGLKNQFDLCHYMITAPDKKKIEVEVRSISRGYDASGCPSGGVEIKAQKDQKMTGHRFCSTNGTGGPIVSKYNRLPIILFNRLSKMQVIFTYRYVD